MNSPQLSVVVPCYNEAVGLAEFHRRLLAVCQGLNCTSEIVLVNDGSRDETWNRMLGLKETDDRLVLVNLSRNHGHQLALTAGLATCLGERILIIDADLQDPPELLPEMMRLMDEGADVVYGQRRLRRGESAFKLYTASFFYRFIDWLSDTRIPRDTGDFRLISRRALDVLLKMPEQHRFIRGMVAWVGFKQIPILYDRDQRFAGETSYPLTKMIRLAVDAITSFSRRPLVLATYLGFCSALASIVLMAYVLIGYMFFNTVSGWASIMIVILMASGMQLFVLGIIGEYLGRLYVEVKGRPLFVVESVVRGPSALITATDSGFEQVHEHSKKFDAVTNAQGYETRRE